MSDEERKFHFPKAQLHAFVVNLPDKQYLSDEGQPVDFNFARVFRNRNLAYDLADIFNGKVEIIGLEYTMTGLVMREPKE